MSDKDKDTQKGSGDPKDNQDPNQTPDDQQGQEDEETKALKQKNGELQDQLNNVVNELKSTREKHRKELESLSNKGDDQEPDGVDKKIQDALQKDKQQDKERARQKAFERFVSENKEFHEDNDPGHIKRDALETEFNSFNTLTLSDVDDFLQVYKKAHKLIKKPKQQDYNEVPPDNTEPDNSGTPKGKSKEIELSDEETTAIEQAGISKERYLELKESNPDYIASLLG